MTKPPKAPNGPKTPAGKTPAGKSGGKPPVKSAIKPERKREPARGKGLGKGQSGPRTAPAEKVPSSPRFKSEGKSGPGVTPTGKNTSGRGQRDLRVRVKSAKGRKLSSTLWLERQLNDPYVVRAHKEGYRGRAAYKIMELDDKFRFLVPGARVVDLGCAPGGWCQVAVQRVNALGERGGKRVGTILGVDLQEVEALAGAELHQLDFLDEGADDLVKGWLGGEADVVMSDMAASSSGHQATDHLRIIILCEAAAQFAFDVLAEGGTFVAKVLAGGTEQELLNTLKKNFTKVANVKPPASRSNSSEKFVVAMGFKGRPKPVENADEA
jgi:23S rRNA (uridine2552-2'-O)-methyltransferase